MNVYTEIMMQQHFSGKNVPPEEFLLPSYVNVFILMIISIAVFKFIFYYGCNHVWNAGVCMEKMCWCVYKAIAILTYRISLIDGLYHIITQVTAAAVFPQAPGGNNLVPQHALLSHKTCRYECSHLTAAALWTNSVGGKFPCFRNHGGVELWLRAIKHLFSNFWDFFKIVNLFQEALVLRCHSLQALLM